MRWVYLLFLWFNFFPAFGVQVPDLYEALVPAEGKDGTAETKALETALEIVLVKLTGAPDVAAKPEAEPLLKNAQAYVEEYGYVETPAKGTSQGSASGSQNQLRAVFDPRILDQAMKKAGLPLWNRERPSILVWLTVEDEGISQFVSTGHPMGYTGILEGQATRRGLPLFWPMLDLEDESKLTPNDLAGAKSEAILAASLRYHPDVVLAVTLAHPVPEQWDGRWTLYFNGQASTSWTSSGDYPQLVLEEGFEGAADILVAQYQRPLDYTAEMRLDIAIEGISGVDDFTRAQSYLRALGPVKQISVKRLEANRAWFSVLAQGGAEALDQSISLGDTLEAVPSEAGHYRLLPPSSWSP